MLVCCSGDWFVASFLIAQPVCWCQGGVWISWYEVVCLYPVPVFKWFVAQVTMCCGTFHGSRSAPVVATVELLLLCFAFGAVNLDWSVR